MSKILFNLFPILTVGFFIYHNDKFKIMILNERIYSKTLFIFFILLILFCIISFLIQNLYLQLVYIVVLFVVNLFFFYVVLNLITLNNLGLDFVINNYLIVIQKIYSDTDYILFALDILKKENTYKLIALVREQSIENHYELFQLLSRYTRDDLVLLSVKELYSSFKPTTMESWEYFILNHSESIKLIYKANCDEIYREDVYFFSVLFIYLIVGVSWGVYREYYKLQNIINRTNRNQNINNQNIINIGAGQPQNNSNNQNIINVGAGQPQNNINNQNINNVNVVNNDNDFYSTLFNRIFDLEYSIPTREIFDESKYIMSETDKFLLTGHNLDLPQWLLSDWFLLLLLLYYFLVFFLFINQFKKLILKIK